MNKLLKTIAKILSLSPFVYLIAILAGGVLYPTTAEMAQRLIIALNAGIAASILFVIGVLAYRIACQRDRTAFFQEKKWFIVCAVPLLTFFPIGFIAGAAVVGYLSIAQLRINADVNEAKT